MKNFTAVLYKTIGNRIKKRRTEAHLTQNGLYPQGRVVLSKIESGIAEKKRNPYFINGVQIEDLSKHPKMHITPDELIWGTQTEKIALVKEWVLSILLNDSSNPFYNGSLVKWIDNELLYLPYDERVSMKNNIQELEKTYGYFFSPERSESYSSINPSFDSEYEELSHLIFRQLLQDYDFTDHCISHIINYTRNSNSLNGLTNQNEDVVLKNLIENLILGKSSYGAIMLDKIGTSYFKFILAFNKFWNRAGAKYMQFFEKDLFIDETTLLNRGLKDISNKKIHDIFLSDEFIDMNKRLLLLPEYTESEAILSSLNLRFKLIRAIQKTQIFDEDFDAEFAFSLSEIIALFKKNSKEYFAISEYNEEQQ